MGTGASAQRQDAVGAPSTAPPIVPRSSAPPNIIHTGGAQSAAISSGQAGERVARHVASPLGRDAQQRVAALTQLRSMNGTTGSDAQLLAMSLGMNPEDLLFNMTFFGGPDATRSDNLGAAMNSVAEETLAAHSNHNTPYKLRPMAAADLTSLRSEVLPYCPVDCRECGVCQESFEEGCRVIRLPFCRHLFHDECLLHWVQLQDWCPFCRCSIAHDPLDSVHATEVLEDEDEQSVALAVTTAALLEAVEKAGENSGPPLFSAADFVDGVVAEALRRERFAETKS